MAGHAQLKFIMTECSKTQIRLTRLIYFSVANGHCWQPLVRTSEIQMQPLTVMCTIIEPRQANLCLRAFRHDKIKLRMPSHSEGPGIWLSVWRFLLTHCLYRASSEGSGETARMRRLAWTFAARIGDEYQIRLTRPNCERPQFNTS